MISGLRFWRKSPRASLLVAGADRVQVAGYLIISFSGVDFASPGQQFSRLGSIGRVDFLGSPRGMSDG